MNKIPNSTLIAVLLVCILLSSCAPGEAALEKRDTLYQVSTLNSLMAGNYDGLITASRLVKKGDFGIGTFAGLDGEMVLLDGHLYQVKDSGIVEIPQPSIELPFSAVTFFDVDTSAGLSQVQNYDALKALIDRQIVAKDKFYAVKVEGAFSAIKVRSVPKQKKPYPVLSEVTKNQPVFDYENVSGTLVGFWCPDYVGSVNVPGYHLHFISDDHTKGGHLLDVAIINGSVVVDETRFFEMTLGGDPQQNGGLENVEEEMQQVEQ